VYERERVEKERERGKEGVGVGKWYMEGHSIDYTAYTQLHLWPWMQVDYIVDCTYEAGSNALWVKAGNNEVPGSPPPTFIVRLVFFHNPYLC
jgi:hypothetical protein